MSVNLEFINLIIPISTIEKYYLGGFEAFKIDNADRRVWYDDYIVRDGAMNVTDINNLLSYWKEKGVNLYREVEDDILGKIVFWDEICVLGLPNDETWCDWIAFNDNNSKALYVPALKTDENYNN